MLRERVRMLSGALTVTVAGTSAVLPAARRRKVLVVIEAALIALLNVAVTLVLNGTPVAPGAEIGRASCRERAGVTVEGVSVQSEVPLVSVTAAATVAV